jgi:type III pantothenate kinase
MAEESWLGLMIGNSRLHWAWFNGMTLNQAWDTPHLQPDQIAWLIEHRLDFAACSDFLPSGLSASNIPAGQRLWLASVIPAQTSLWQVYSLAQVIRLGQIPIAGLYPTLGIDRALALLGAATRYGLPSLVIDAGTALSFTGANAVGQFVGGAILPGLQLQLRSLSEHTAALPHLSSQQPQLPQRWATNTTGAIWSGVLYSLLASLQEFVTAWRQEFTDGSIVLTGGDAVLLMNLLQQRMGSAKQIQVDRQIIFWGMQQIVG